MYKALLPQCISNTWWTLTSACCESGEHDPPINPDLYHSSSFLPMTLWLCILYWVEQMLWLVQVDWYWNCFKVWCVSRSYYCVPRLRLQCGSIWYVPAAFWKGTKKHPLLCQWTTEKLLEPSAHPLVLFKKHNGTTTGLICAFSAAAWHMTVPLKIKLIK